MITMPERDYFSLKYTVPGFALILVVVGLTTSQFTLFWQDKAQQMYWDWQSRF
jgi:hypothetical protein